MDSRETGQRYALSLKLWTHAVLFGALVYALCAMYTFLYIRSWSIGILNRTLADTAILIMAYSMALSGLSYFFGYFRPKLAYRRYYGLLGFAFALVHATLSVYLYVYHPLPPDYDFWYVWDVFGIPVSNTIPFAAGAAALVLFGFMTLISNTLSTRLIGAVLWRHLLRIGYYAAILVSIHFTIKAAGEWSAWFGSFYSPVPPMSVLIALFIYIVIGLRIALWRATAYQKKRKESVPV